MARIQKIDGNIKESIIIECKNNPGVSCRILSKILEKKLHLRISKSTINGILKESGLSDRVGRKPKIRNAFNASKIVPELPQPAAQQQMTVKQVESSIASSSIAPPPVELVQAPLEIPQGTEPAQPVAEEPSIDEPLPGIPLQEASAEIPAPEISASAPSPIPEQERIEPEPAGSARIEPVPVNLCVPEPPAFALQDGESKRVVAGLVLLKSLDYLIQGISRFSEIIAQRAGCLVGAAAEKLETILYQEFMLAFKRIDIDYSPLDAVLGKRITSDILAEYARELSPATQGAFSAELDRERRALFRDIRSVRMTLSDGKTFCIDSQHHTVWSTLNIPHEFSTTRGELMRSLMPELAGEAPFVLFMAPGYDVPTKDFFHFLASLDTTASIVSKCTLHGSASDEVDVIQAPPARRSCVFAIWPWQYASYRAVRTIGQFVPFTDERTGCALYRADIEIELQQPELNQKIVCTGCALKTSPSEKTRMVILSRGLNTQDAASYCALVYLRHWPNMDEALRDFSRKVELFTYTAQAVHQAAETAQAASEDGGMVFLRRYATALASYYARFFHPQGQDKEHSDTLTSPVFSGYATLSRQGGRLNVVFETGGAPYTKDLEYACSRLNERLIRLSALDVYFSVKSA